MFNRITTLALAAISTQAIKLDSLSQADAEGVWQYLPRRSLAQADAEGVWKDLNKKSLAQPYLPKASFAQADAEADAEIGQGFDKYERDDFWCKDKRCLAQVDAEADAEGFEVWCKDN